MPITPHIKLAFLRAMQKDFDMSQALSALFAQHIEQAHGDKAEKKMQNLIPSSQNDPNAKSMVIELGNFFATLESDSDHHAAVLKCIKMMMTSEVAREAVFTRENATPNTPYNAEALRSALKAYILLCGEYHYPEQLSQELAPLTL